MYRSRRSAVSLYDALPKVLTHNQILSPPSKPATMIKLDVVADGIDIDDLITIKSFGGKTEKIPNWQYDQLQEAISLSC